MALAGRTGEKTHNGQQVYELGMSLWFLGRDAVSGQDGGFDHSSQFDWLLTNKTTISHKSPTARHGVIRNDEK